MPVILTFQYVREAGEVGPDGGAHDRRGRRCCCSVWLIRLTEFNHRVPRISRAKF